MVCAVLALLSAVTLPSVVAMRASRERQVAYEDILRLAQAGRETAIASGKVYTLTLDDGGTVRLQQAETAETSRDGQATESTDSSVPQIRIPNGVVIGASENPSSPDASSNGEVTDLKSATLPSGASFGEVVLADKPSSSSDFTLHFYPDGRSEGGGFEIRYGPDVRSILIDREGIARLTEDNLPPTDESSWEAGQYEQRATN